MRRDTGLPPGGFDEVTKDSLADTLARRLGAMIQAGEYGEGDRLPAILEMARRFGVGPPTVREALKKLETLGVVDVRHGSGVYVASRRELLVLARPSFGGVVERRLLVDVIEARIPLELETVRAATANATGTEIDSMRRLLESAGDAVNDDHRLAAADAAFHRQIAAVSGNTILAQMLDALHDLFTDEGRVVRWGPLARDADVRAHFAILEAIEHRDAPGAAERMRAHLESVRDAVGAAGGEQRTA
jgi:GntR family transcriptional repressor for pyruvate dehydrogenase complex